jgi:hypothetical protein
MVAPRNTLSPEPANGPPVPIDITCVTNAALRVWASNAKTVVVALAADPTAFISLLPRHAMDLAARLVEAAADVREGARS